MKTNQVMIREKDKFLQRTKDGYFNATKLIENWNENNNKKQLAQYKITKSTKDFIEQLKKEGIEKPMISGRGKGKNSGTWMHPKLFVDFAMWVSVEFKSQVIDYVLDGLIKGRNDAGDYYNEMTAAIMERYINYYGCKPNPKIYIEEANFIKQLVGLKNGNRNVLSEEKLNQITILQKQNTNMIQKGFSKEKRRNLMKMFAEAF